MLDDESARAEIVQIVEREVRSVRAFWDVLSSGFVNWGVHLGVSAGQWKTLLVPAVAADPARTSYTTGVSGEPGGGGSGTGGVWVGVGVDGN